MNQEIEKMLSIYKKKYPYIELKQEQLINLPESKWKQLILIDEGFKELKGKVLFTKKFK